MSPTFRSLAVPNFRRYATGAVASNVGTWMHRVAQAWLVLELTGDATMLGVAIGLQFAPMLILGPIAGSLADRRDRRRLLVMTQIALAVQALALGTVVILGGATPVLVLGSAALLGLVTAIDAPARQAFVGDLVPPSDLPNAVALNSASFHAARLVGPAVAGLVIAEWGTGPVFLLNSLTFGAMLFALFRLEPTWARPMAVHRTGGVKDGMRFVASHRDLLYVMILMGIVAMLALNFQMMIAIMSTQEFRAGPATYGVLGSAMAVGSLVGALVSARRGRTSVRLVFTSATILGFATAVAGLMPTLASFAVSLAICGALALTMMTAATSYLQTRSGTEHRGRVMALYLALFFGTTPIGAPIVGWMVEQWGPRTGLVLPGLLSAAAAVVVGLLYARRGRRRPRRLQRSDAYAIASSTGSCRVEFPIRTHSSGGEDLPAERNTGREALGTTSRHSSTPSTEGKLTATEDVTNAPRVLAKKSRNHSSYRSESGCLTRA